jgi:hypothetical protein
MNIFLLSPLFAVISVASASAATTSISFWAFDQYPGSSPYYSHYRVTGSDPDYVITDISNYDRGWGFATTGASSYHIMTSIENNTNNSVVLRSTGWHKYEMNFNNLTMTASILVDGSTIRNEGYSSNPTNFRFGFHDYFGGTQETVIDDFEYRINGGLVYSQGFESGVLDSGWSITRLDGGTYVTSGDTTTPHTGNGSLALGATTGGNLFSLMTFDLTSVPEPTSGLLVVLTSALLIGRRKR